jgi:hypothetical protein
MPPLSSIDWSGFHDWLERWAPLAEWGVVLGTLGLAAATVWLASRTNKAAEAAQAEAMQVAAQGAAALRAHVYPETTAQWAWGTEGGASGLGQRVLPLRNGGPGVAINVEGQVRRGTEGERIALYAGSIAPGHIINARPAVQIEGGWGAWLVRGTASFTTATSMATGGRRASRSRRARATRSSLSTSHLLKSRTRKTTPERVGDPSLGAAANPGGFCPREKNPRKCSAWERQKNAREGDRPS